MFNFYNQENKKKIKHFRNL